MYGWLTSSQLPFIKTVGIWGVLADHFGSLRSRNITNRGAVVAQWIRLRILNRGVPGSKLLAAAVVPLSKALYPHCLVLGKDLKPLVPWLLTYKQLAFLVVR